MCVPIFDHNLLLYIDTYIHRYILYSTAMDTVATTATTTTPTTILSVRTVLVLVPVLYQLTHAHHTRTLLDLAYLDPEIPIEQCSAGGKCTRLYSATENKMVELFRHRNHDANSAPAPPKHQTSTTVSRSPSDPPTTTCQKSCKVKRWGETSPTVQIPSHPIPSCLPKTIHPISQAKKRGDIRLADLPIRPSVPQQFRYTRISHADDTLGGD